MTTQRSNRNPSGGGLTVTCPTCHTNVEWGTQSPFRPFCSDRCRLIDLGAWANEEHRIAGRYDDHSNDDYSDNGR